MEIKNLNSNMINAYKNISGSGIRKDKGTGGVKSGGEKFDKIEFDFGRAVESAKSDIAAEINRETDAERISALKTAYCGDSCPVHSDDIAGEILS